MIRALVWKEAREQGLIVIALAVLGVGVLLGVGLLNPPAAIDSSSRPGSAWFRLLTDPGFLALVALVVAAGTVVGGTLFAGEKEAGTFAYLTHLPVSRRKIWIGKVCGGGVLVLAVFAALFAAAAGVGIIGPTQFLPTWALAFGTVALAAFGWGMVGSGMARNSLAAAGLGALFAVLATAGLFPLGVALLGEFSRIMYRYFGQGYGSPFGTVSALATLFVVFGIPYLISLWTFTEPDRNRKQRAVLGPNSGKKRSWHFQPKLFGWTKRVGTTFRAGVWLTWRQTRMASLVLTLLGLACGGAMFIPGTPVIAVWPSVTFFLTVLVGVIGWADEQGSGASRFWLERRMPIGRLWASKVFVGVIETLFILVAVALPTILRMAITRVSGYDRGSWLLFDYDFPRYRYLLMWPIYGLVFGHLMGLLFRKALVAVSVALMVGGVAAALWLPSLLAGGIHHWQLWLPPLLVLATARALVWSMAADRLGSRRALSRLTLGGVAVAAAFGGGIAYRVLEIPNVPERNDDLAFRDTIPRLDASTAGMELRRVAVIFQVAREGRLVDRASIIGREPTPANPYNLTDPLHLFPNSLQVRMESTLEHGWQPGDAAFEAWLDRMFEGQWHEVLQTAVRLPEGTLEDPRELTLNTPLRHLYGLQGADAVLLVQGLRRQAEGDPAAFVQAFEMVLGMSRTVRNKSILASALVARQMEVRAYQALARWLEREPGQPDLLGRIESALLRYDSWATNDLAEVRWAEQTVLRNSFQSSGDVLRRQWHYAELSQSELIRGMMDTEADLVGFAWAVPWEKERHQRLVGLGNREAYPKEWSTWSDEIRDTLFPPHKTRRLDFDAWNRFPFIGVPGISSHPLFTSWNLKPQHEYADQRAVANRRAARLLLAIRRHQLDRGSVPPSLEALVPDYLPAVLLDPCDGKPFRYRISDGEEIIAHERTAAPVRDTNEPAKLPRDQDMAWSGTPIAFQPIGPGGGWGALRIPGIDPFPAVVSTMAREAENVIANAPFQALVQEFVQKRAGVTAVTGFAAVLDSYLSLISNVTVPSTGPYQRTIALRPGTAVIWSIGTDKIDHGGTEFATAGSHSGRDWVHVVPPIPNVPNPKGERP